MIKGNIDKRYGKMMFTAMKDCGRTRRIMMDAMQVSSKTIYNWENGYSYPNVKQMSEWFDILGADMNLYYNIFFCSDRMQGSSSMSDNEIRRKLHEQIDSYTKRRRALLHFILCGKHGADIDSLINLTVCYLQTQWKDRIVQAALTLSNYRLNRERKEYPIEPNTDLLHATIQTCSESYISGQDGYNIKGSKKKGE